MKKLVTIIMAVVLMISLAACGETKKPTEEISDSTEVTTENSTTEDVYKRQEKHSVYSNMERDAMVVIRECANINIKIEEKEEKQDMCKAIDDMVKDARMSGEARGEARGEAERKIMQKELDEKQNRLDKYEKEIEELKKQLAERQTA